MAQPSWIDRIRSRSRREEAQTMSEYAVILGVIVVGIFAAIGVLSGAIAAPISTTAALF